MQASKSLFCFFPESGQGLGMARPPMTDKWPEIRRLAEQGVSLAKLCDEYKVPYSALKMRSRRENWLTFNRMNQRLANMLPNVAAGASPGPLPPEKEDGDKNEVAYIAANWDERASYIRQLAWQIGKKSLAPLKDTGIMIKDAGDLAKTVKLMREATGLFQDQSAVQVSIFGGAAAGFDGKTVDIETEIINDAPDYDEEM